MSLQPANSTNQIVFMGECMAELRRTGQWNGQSVPLSQGFAGDSFNAAIYCQRQLGRELYYLTGIGEDSISDNLVSFAKANGVHSDYMLAIPEHTLGMYLIDTDEHGEREFTYWRKHSAATRLMEDPRSLDVLRSLKSGDVLYLSGISLAVLGYQGRRTLLEILGKCRQTGVCIVYDNNYRPRLWRGAAEAADAQKQIAALADLLLLTWEDELPLFGWENEAQALNDYAKISTAEIVIKRDAQPCLIHYNGVTTEVPGRVVEQVVDTTAAGDSFGGTYLAARLQGHDPEQAARQAHLIAGTVIQHPGAIIPVELMSFAS